jgi:hypothetical protein
MEISLRLTVNKLRLQRPVLCMEITAFLLDSYEALKHMVNDHGE